MFFSLLCLILSYRLSPFSAAITEFHRLGICKEKFIWLTVLEAERSKSMLPASGEDHPWRKDGRQESETGKRRSNPCEKNMNPFMRAEPSRPNHLNGN